MKQQIVISKHFKSDLASSIAECERDKIFVLVDTNTHNTCWPLIQDYFSLKNAIVITIEASDAHKDLQSLCHIVNLRLVQRSHKIGHTYVTACTHNRSVHANPLCKRSQIWNNAEDT